MPAKYSIQIIGLIIGCFSNGQSKLNQNFKEKRDKKQLK